MKHFLSKILTTLAILFTISCSIAIVSPQNTAFADGPGGTENCRFFLGMTSWDCGTYKTVDSEDKLTNNIIIIAGNVFADLTVIASYLVLGYVIYGGYLYMFSSGDVGKIANGKKTLMHAFIGLAIVLSSNIILNTIRIALIGNTSLADCTINTECIKPDQMVTNLIQWFLGFCGVVAAIFIVVGGVGYMTSSGDVTKLQKAKKTILYALIGLAIVGLAEAVTAFVSSTIRNANTSFNNDIIIAKEDINEN